jgi:hypothetical protein
MDLKAERLSLVVTFDAGPLAGKLRREFPLELRRK